MHLIHKSLIFAFISLMLLFIPFSTNDTFAQLEELIVITTDQSSYQEGDTIVISGEVRDRLYNSPISITVFSPDGLTIASAIVYIDSYNKFQREITAGGTMIDEGTYTIRVQVYIDSAVRTAETTFEFQSSQQPDCGPNQVFQLGVCQDIDVMSSVNVDLEIYPVPFDKTANDMVTLEFTAKSDALKGALTGAIDHLDYKVIISKDGNEIWSQQFHDHDGNLELKITPSEGTFTTTGGQEVGTSETKAFMVKGPVFMDNGNYQVTAQIVGIEFNPLPTPLTDDFNMQVDGGKPLPTSITVSIDKLTYDFSSTIFVNGKVTNPKSGTFVALLVKNPTNQIVTVDELSIDTYGSFNTRLSTTGNNWAEDGTYTIRIQYGNQVYDETTIKLFGGTAITPITVSTDKTSYNYGETIIISGQVSERLDNTPIGLTVIFPDGRIVTETLDVDYNNKFQVHLSTAGTLWKLTGTYTITVQQGTQKHATSFYLEGSQKPSPAIGIVDTVPPLLFTPSDMTIDANDSSGARVDYSVIVIDDEDGVLRPSCSPFSGALFPIGETTVSCSAIDYSGNSDKKSFVITVNAPDLLIPSWIKDVAEFWCGDKIVDVSFIEAIQYLINNDVIVVPATTSSGSGSQEIPNWIKNNACWWSQGLITNSDFASGLQYLIGQGIIRV